MSVAAVSLALALPVFVANAQAPKAPAQTPNAQTKTPDLSDQKLDAAAAALERVSSLKQTYEAQITQAAPDAQERIKTEASGALEKAVTDQGLSVEEYNSIIQVAQNDPQIRQKILQRVKVK
jgi:predicted ATPase with chaperone activity